MRSLLWRPLSAIAPVVCGRVSVPCEHGNVKVKEMLSLREVNGTSGSYYKSRTYVEVESACRAMKN